MARLINFRAEDGKGAHPIETPYLTRLNYSIASWLSVTAVLVPKPPVVIPTLLFLDVSKWNGRVDFAKAKESGARAVWIKSDQGAWTDSRLDDHIESAEAAGIDHGFYHFCDPEQTTITPETAARHCADLTNGIGNLSTWLDVERTGNLGPQGLLDYCIRWINTYQDMTGKLVEIYTRMTFFNPYVARSNFFSSNNIRLNAARYHLGLSTPWSDGRYRPLDWSFDLSEFDEWQYSADGNGMGSYFGAESNSIDLNLFAGTEDRFVEVYNPYPKPPDPPLPGDLEERVNTLERKVTTLEGYHQPAPDTISVVVTDDKANAMAQVGTNSAGYPIIEKNVYQETGDPTLHKETGETFTVYPDLIRADGAKYFYKIAGVPLYGYPALYVDSSKVD